MFRTEKEILDVYCKFCEDEIKNYVEVATDKKFKDLLAICGGRSGLYHQGINRLYGATMFASQLGVDFDKIDNLYNHFTNKLVTSIKEEK